MADDEVEKKFRLDGAADLFDYACFVGETVNHDVYWDDRDYTLMQDNIWCRWRNGVAQIKDVRGNGHVKRSKEYIGSRIVDRQLRRAGVDKTRMHQLVTVSTRRRSYRMGWECDGETTRVNIDADRVRYSQGEGFSVLELEVMGRSRDHASRVIDDAAASFGLRPDDKGRKIVRWMRSNDETLYELFCEYNR